MAVEITRKELTATALRVAALRSAAGKVKDSRTARRMLAVALVPEGADRARAAATTSDRTSPTLRDTV